MRFLSLFSGIGGFDLGFERAGLECVGQVEIGAACNALLAHYWPDVWRCDDVRKVNRGNAPAVDLVCGGFPCQDLSVAGRRAGLAGERSGLWFEFARIIAELEPAWVVIENVPGLFSSWSGDAPPDDLQPGARWETTEESDLLVVLQWLVQCGYGVAWRVFDAQYAGVAQRRRRVFIVGHLGDGRAAEVLFEREGVRWDPPARGEAGQDVAGSIAASTGGSDENDARDGRLIALAFTERTRKDGRALESQDELAYALDNPGDGGRAQTRLVAFGLSENQRAEVRLTEYSRQITSGGGKPGQGYPCVFESRYARNGRGAPDTVVPPLKAESGQTGKGDGAPLVVGALQSHTKRHGHAMSTGQAALDAGQVLPVGIGVRRLTPTECERLQGFPDGWTAVNGQSDSARYRQLGNAVCVPVAAWLGRRIMEAAD